MNEKEKNTPEKTPPEPRQILIVDDDPAILRLLGVYLMSAGFRVIPVQSGEEALDALSGLLPDLILLDVKMPGMDGFETFKRVRGDSRLSDVPVIFLTSASDPVSKVRGYLSDAEDYLIKTTRREKLLARIETVLSRTCCKDS